MLVALTLAAVSAAPAVPPQASGTVYRVNGRAACPPAPLIATRAGPPSRTQKLTELPPAQHILAVEKRVGGCAVNVLKQRDLAGNHVMVPAAPAGVRSAPVSKRGRR